MRILFLIAMVFSVAGPAYAQEAPTPEQVRFFETSIRPLLSERCFRCHGPGKERGDLRLDSRARLLKGGETGPAVIAGDPEKESAHQGRAPHASRKPQNAPRQNAD